MYCDFRNVNEQMERYHDEEWGRPLYDDRRQFEFLMLEALQCGLNWTLMLKKRAAFNEAFAGFDYDKVAEFTEKDIERILTVPDMLRSVPKIKAVIKNAAAFQAIRAEFDSFSKYIWGWTDGRTYNYSKHAAGYIPASNGLSKKIAKDLKQRGFSYLGPVTVYSHLQAAGIINDHGAGCPCREFCLALNETVDKRCDDEDAVHYYGD